MIKVKVGFYTLGCKVNLYESEYMIAEFQKRGYEICDYKDKCDIYVINTCTVTNQSDAKSRKIINQVKRHNNNAIIVACGCFIESANKQNYNFENIDIIIGNSQKSKVVDLVEEYQKTKQQINEVAKHDVTNIPFEDMTITHLEGKTRAFVKIQDGCENFCTYCIIPYVRGKCRSKEPKKVIEEITTLVNKGYKEIVLTGIHTGNYGRDKNTDFSTLLEDILKIPNLKRVRISSIEMTELDDKFFHLLKNKIICDHLHIPIQSGSNTVLKRMNRKYKKEQFIKKIEELRKIRPNISITTDVIVGFPGETEEEWQETIETIKQINFSKIHVFPYSKREGTKAASMPNQVNDMTKKQRVKELLALSDELEEKYQKANINQKEEILIEKQENNLSYGHTTNYLYLKIPTDKMRTNEIYNINIKEEYFEK